MRSVDHESTVSRRGFFRRTIQTTILTRGIARLGLNRLLPNVGRLEFARTGAAVGLGLVLASLEGHLNQAIANAEGYKIEDISWEEGNGVRSYLWLPGRDGYGDLKELDDAAEVYRGYRVPKPTGDYLYEWILQRIARTPHGREVVGDCLAAALAAGASPKVDGDREAFGVTFPRMEVEVLAVLHHRYSKLVRPEWKGPLNRDQLEKIWLEYQQLQVTPGPRNHLIVDTAAYRGRPGQWWGWLKDFDGDGNFILVDFLEQSELETRINSGSDLQKLYGPVPFNQVSAVQLRNPYEPALGQEAGFEYTVDREVIKVVLGKARATPR